MFSFTYFGHAAVLVNFEKHLLFDPGIINREPLVDPKAIQASYILVTHTPTEHMGNAVTIANDIGGVLVGNNDVCDYARREGIYGYAVVELKPEQPLDIGANIQIHGFNLSRAGFLAPKNTAFLIETNQGSVLHLGHAKEVGVLANSHPDLLCVPVAGKKAGTFSPEAAVEAALSIHPRYAFPISGTNDQVTQFLDMLKGKETDIVPLSLAAGQSYTLV
jgi:L-ascorbate metabolism protein UlaG (beta-lactamase superfamily)